MVFRTLTAASRAFSRGVLALDISAYTEPAMVLHNWQRPYRLSTTFRTSVSLSTFDGDESRVSSVIRPYRKATSLHTALTEWDTWLRRRYMGDHLTNQNLPVPIYSDQMKVLSLAGSVVTVDSTDFRRIFIGQYVSFVPKPAKSTDTVSSSQCGLGVVTAFTSTTVTFSGLIGTAPSADWLMFPCMQVLQARPSSRSARLLTSSISEWPQSVEEIVAPDSLVPQVQDGEDVSGLGFDYHVLPSGYSVPVLHEKHNWAETLPASATRPSVSYRSGSAARRRMDQKKPTVKETIVETNFSREAYWNLMRFFESRQGRTRPFVYVGNETIVRGDAAYVGGGQTLLILDNIGFPAEMADQIYGFYITTVAGVVLLSQISSIVTAPLNKLHVTLVSMLPLDGTDVDPVASIRPVFRARFAKDSLEEEWETTEIVNAKLEIQTISNSRDFTF